MNFSVLVVVGGIILLLVVASRINKMGKSGTDRPASSSSTKRSAPGGRRISLASGSVEKAREAWLSGDLQRMINALHSKAKLVDRHFLLMTVVEETYRLRADPRMAEKCLEVAQIHVEEFPEIARALKREFGGDLPRVSTFQHYATLLTERGEFDQAIQVCESAISFDLHDGTRSGYEGRIDRIRKRSAKMGSKKGSESEAKISSSTEILAASRSTQMATESYSDPHRQRKRPLSPEVFRFDDVPFISLPRAPEQWAEGEAKHAKNEDEGAEEAFEILGEPDWDLSAPTKLPPDDRPDPAYRLHFSAQSGPFLVDDLGNAKDHPGAPACVLSFGSSGDRLGERPLSWNLYRLQINPMGSGLIGVSSDQVLHCYDEHLNTLVAFPLTDTPEIRAAKSRFGVPDH